MKVFKEFRFEAAHHLVGYEGPCKNEHGHGWTLTVGVEGEVGPDQMVMDYSEIKQIVNETIISKVDHQDLNKVFEVDKPTSEYLLKRFWLMLNPYLPGLCLLRLYETPTNWAEFEGI